MTVEARQVLKLELLQRYNVAVAEQEKLQEELRVLAVDHPLRELRELQLLHLRRLLNAYHNGMRKCDMPLPEASLATLRSSFASAAAINQMWLTRADASCILM